MGQSADKYGFHKMQAYQGSNRTGKYSFYRETKDETVLIWIKPTKSDAGYEVEKSVKVDPFKFENHSIAMFATAVQAKKWVNQEFANMFENSTGA